MTPEVLSSHEHSYTSSRWAHAVCACCESQACSMVVDAYITHEDVRTLC